jgi:undecaprenyl-diphosphatase
MLASFALWTIVVCCVDVQAIGPQESRVGFATVNRLVHDLTGVHMYLYTLTDWLSLIPLVCIMGFGFLGLVQWIQRKHLGKVDFNLLALGGFYIVVMAVYLFFEVVVMNYRPVLIQGILEPSYPSSTTMLVMCVMPTAIMQLHVRMKTGALKRIVLWTIAGFTVFMVIGRLISGVHWVTDIIGGGLLSAGLVLLYRGIISGK